MLLNKIGIKFHLIEPIYLEELNNEKDPVEYVKINAVEKAKSVIDQIDEGVLISADTIVVKNGEILEKPVDQGDAKRMLEKLSGTSHEVYTAVVVIDKTTSKMEVEVEMTKVFMREIDGEEIQRYIDSKEPFDAAGAYKIQERGSKFITRIEGCFSNVIGLPVATLVKMLEKFNIKV